jgi:putative flippase GtrA
MLPRLAGQSQNLGDEFTRAVLTGGVATIVDMAALALLVSWLDWSYLSANVCSFSAGTAVNYAISIAWVFPNRSMGNWLHEAIVFALAGLLGLAVSQSVMFVCVEWLGLYYLVAKVIATGCHFAFNFSSRKVLLFRQREPS